MRIFKLDWTLAISTALLLSIGLVALYGISLGGSGIGLLNFKKQLVSCAIGLVLMFFVSFYDYRVFGRWATGLYFSGLIILTLVIFWGTSVHGTTGWIGLGTFNIQPVEIIKLVMIIFLASFLSKKKNQLSISVRIIASIFLVFIPVILILFQPDFGSAAILGGGWIFMLVLSGVDKKNLFVILIGASLVIGSSWFFFKDYQKERIVNFINPARDPRGSGYNVIQSMVAVGSGQMLGKGLGRGSQSQLDFLPEKHSDFIFAVVAEEFGLLGAGVVLVLFGVMFYRLKQIALVSRDNFGYLTAMGIVCMLFLQVLVNVGMNIGVTPVAGVPLPLVSYGGSSLVAVLISLGIAQSVYMRRTSLVD